MLKEHQAKHLIRKEVQGTARPDMMFTDTLPGLFSLTLSLTLCGLTGQKTHQGGPGLGGSVHEEAHPCFPYFAQRTFKSNYAGGFHRPLVQLIPPINYSIRKEIFTTVPCAPKFN